MKPEDVVKYVFSEERQDYQSRALKCRKAELVQARQRSMYLVKYFFPQMKWELVGNLFDQKHDGAIHAYNQVTNFIATEKAYQERMAKYISVLRNKQHNRMKVNCKSAEYKMINKRAILHKTDEGWIILLKRLNGRTVEKKHIIISNEAMIGLVESYQILK